jgi:hypothetical protein
MITQSFVFGKALEVFPKEGLDSQSSSKGRTGQPVLLVILTQELGREVGNSTAEDGGDLSC